MFSSIFPFYLECCEDPVWCEQITESCSNQEIQSHCPEKCKDFLPNDNPCLSNNSKNTQSGK